MLFFSVIAAGLASTAFAQFPTAPEGVTVKDVKGKPGVSISYKQTHICETKHKGYAGYVHLPSSYLNDVEDSSDPYNISMFFWYFEARHRAHKAPTAIYLAGGPGDSSMVGATSDGGPCTILPDSNSTANNPYSWTNVANMLYIDQPTAVGFSYDTLVNATRDLLYMDDELLMGQLDITPFEAYNGTVPPQNSTFLYGTFPSNDPSHTANGSVVAAATLWHFAQVFFTGFPEYKTHDKRISYWGNSYAGYYLPTSAAYTVQQNAKIRNGTLNGTVLEVDGVGWTNGCVDILYQAEFYPDMAYNNTYGFQAYSEEVYESAKANFSAPNVGCRDAILLCRAAGAQNDSAQFNANDDVNQLCVQALEVCEENVVLAYSTSGHSDYDISHLLPDPFPTSYTNGFFNQAWVQKALGVPLNFTSSSYLAEGEFIYKTADAVRTQGMQYIEYLLSEGVKITMVYGDRDYRCPWNGGENLSLQANWTGADEFRSAGYAPIYTNKECEKNGTSSGVVRQHGNLSFSRIFEAGHDPAAYVPESIFEIFARATQNRDIATGRELISEKGNNYTTQGPVSSFGIKNTLPAPPPVSCYLWAVPTTCTTEQYLALMNGTAVVKDFTIVSPVGVADGGISLGS